MDTCPEEARLIHAARLVNDSKPHHVVHKIEAAAARFKRPVIGLLGLSYKEDIDDLRESPSVEIAHLLMKKKKLGEILVCEPHCPAHPDFALHPLEEVIQRADILVLLVPHRAFRELDRECLKPKVVIDTCGIW